MTTAVLEHFKDFFEKNQRRRHVQYWKPPFPTPPPHTHTPSPTLPFPITLRIHRLLRLASIQVILLDFKTS